MQPNAVRNASHRVYRYDEMNKQLLDSECLGFSSHAVQIEGVLLLLLLSTYATLGLNAPERRTDRWILREQCVHGVYDLHNGL